MIVHREQYTRRIPFLIPSSSFHTTHFVCSDCDKGRRSTSYKKGHARTNSWHSFRVLQESKEYYRWQRTTIEYRVGSSNKRCEIHTGEIDGFSLFLHSFSSRSNHLFSMLEKQDISSYLISHFARCELQGKANYTNPISSEILFTRGSCKMSHDGVTDAYADSDNDNDGFSSSEEPFSEESSQGATVTHYRLKGGMSACSSIMELDSDFFPRLSHAVSIGLCKVGRIDICVDHNIDLMPYISQDISRGYATGFHSHLRGYGVANNKNFDGKNVGARSKDTDHIFKAPDFRLHTLYCGSPRVCGCVVVFYDKKQERLVRNSEQYLDGTRIEVRLYINGKHPSYTKLANLLLSTMCFPRNEGIGQYCRHVIHTALCFSHINFGTRKRKRVFPFSTIYTWSPWYRELFEINRKYCFEASRDANAGVDDPSMFTVERMLPLLASSKKNPEEVVNLYQSQPFQLNNMLSRSASIGKILDEGPTSLLLPSKVQSSGTSLATESPSKKRGRPVGRKDSKKFLVRGRPRKQ